MKEITRTRCRHKTGNNGYFLECITCHWFCLSVRNEKFQVGRESNLMTDWQSKGIMGINKIADYQRTLSSSCLVHVGLLTSTNSTFFPPALDPFG